jgi:hypothetical protein
LLAAKYTEDVAADARALALRMLESVDETRIRWMVDPDGKQIIPELSYMNDVLSSEMPATYLATYWRGRIEKLW